MIRKYSHRRSKVNIVYFSSLLNCSILKNFGLFLNHSLTHNHFIFNLYFNISSTFHLPFFFLNLFKSKLKSSQSEFIVDGNSVNSNGIPSSKSTLGTTTNTNGTSKHDTIAEEKN